MLKCCQQIPREDRKNNLQIKNPKSKYKYSFRQNSHIAIDPVSSSIYGYRLAPNDNKVQIHQDEKVKLDSEYKTMIGKQQNTNIQFMTNMKELQRQVLFFENQVARREKQIQQLNKMYGMLESKRTRSEIKIYPYRTEYLLQKHRIQFK